MGALTFGDGPGIIQMIPADKWYAVYATEAEPYYKMEPMIGWALAESAAAGRQHIYGLDLGSVQAPAEYCEVRDEFLGYAHGAEAYEPERRAYWSRNGLYYVEAKRELASGRAEVEP